MSVSTSTIATYDLGYLARHGAESGYRIFSLFTPPIYFMFIMARYGRSPLSINRILRASWVGGAGGSAICGAGAYARYMGSSEEFIHTRRMQLEYDANRVSEKDSALVGGVLGSLLTSAVLWKRANVVNLVLGGAGWGCGVGVLTHYYRAFEKEAKKAPVVEPAVQTS